MSEPPRVCFASRIQRLSVRAVARAVEDDTGCLLALANGSDAPFMSAWPEGSGAWLDQLVERWRAAEGAPWARVVEAFLGASAALIEAHPPAGDELWGELAPCVGALAVGCTAGQAVCVWVGGHEARLIRDGRLCRRTARDDLATTVGLAGASLPTVLTRTISAEHPGQGPSVAVWPLRAGDRLLLLSFPASAGGPEVTTIADDDAAERLAGSLEVSFVASVGWGVPGGGGR